MPKSSRKKVLKIPFKPFDAGKKGSQKYDSIPLKGKDVNNLKSTMSSFADPNRPKKPSLPRKVLGSNLGKVKIVGDVPQKSTMDVFSKKSPLKSQNVIMKKLPARDASFLNKKVSSSRINTETLKQKKHAAPRFLSTSMGKGRLIKHKASAQLAGRKVGWGAKEVKRLPHAKRLQLFQALQKEPLPFLDLHARFGVSKRTVRRLVKKGFLTEIWGPKAIGVEFKLTDKGKAYCKELEAAAKWEPRTVEKGFVRLKSKA